MTMLTCAHSHMVSRLIAFLSLTPRMGVKKGGRSRPPANKYLFTECKRRGTMTLLPMAGDVDNPMLSRSLLFIMSLVLRGGIRIID